MYLVLVCSQGGELTPRYNGISPVKTAEVVNAAREARATEIVVYHLQEGMVYDEGNFNSPDFLHEIVTYHFKVDSGIVWVDEHHRKFFEWAVA
jgi:hypothetical protein